MGNWDFKTWTASDWFHFWTLIVAGSSAALAFYHHVLEKILIVWIPKGTDRFTHTFWIIADKCAATLEIVAMNTVSQVPKVDIKQEVTVLKQIETTETSTTPIEKK